MTWRARISILLLLVALGVGACSPRPAAGPATPAAPAVASAGTPGQPAAHPASVPTPTPRQANSGPPRPGQPAADLTLPNLADEQVSLADYRGQAVMLNFWATWCGFCQMEIPHMIEAYADLAADGLVILAVDVREGRREVSEYAEEMGIEFPILLDEAGEVAGRYYVRGIPTSVFIDREGIIQRVHAGALSKELLREYIAEVME